MLREKGAVRPQPPRLAGPLYRGRVRYLLLLIETVNKLEHFPNVSRFVERARAHDDRRYQSRVVQFPVAHIVSLQAINAARHNGNSFARCDESQRDLQFPYLIDPARLQSPVLECCKYLIGVTGARRLREDDKRLVDQVAKRDDGFGD